MVGELRNTKRLVWLERTHQGRKARLQGWGEPRSWSLVSHRGDLGFYSR